MVVSQIDKNSFIFNRLAYVWSTFGALFNKGIRA